MYYLFIKSLFSSRICENQGKSKLQCLHLCSHLWFGNCLLLLLIPSWVLISRSLHLGLSCLHTDSEDQFLVTWKCFWIITLKLHYFIRHSSVYSSWLYKVTMIVKQKLWTSKAHEICQKVMTMMMIATNLWAFTMCLALCQAAYKHYLNLLLIATFNRR